MDPELIAEYRQAVQENLRLRAEVERLRKAIGEIIDKIEVSDSIMGASMVPFSTEQWEELCKLIGRN